MIIKKLDFLWSLPRFYKRLISLIIDALFVVLAFVCAYWARLGEFRVVGDNSLWFVLIGTIIVTLLANIKLGLYRAVLRYLTFHAFSAILFGAAVSAFSITTFAYFAKAPIPRTVPIIYFPFLVMLCGGARLLVRAMLVQKSSKTSESVLVLGAGSTGRQLSLALRQASAYQVKGFIDYDDSLVNTIIQGVSVYHLDEIGRLIKKYRIKKVLLAIPRATRSERKKVIDQLLPYAVEVLTVPDFNDIVTGKAKVSELQDVAVDDLLGRDVVEPVASLMQANIYGKVVMVTGAGGSIGSELCRQILVQRPSTMILFDVSEFALYEINKELDELLRELPFDLMIVPLIGSVQNISRLASIMKAFGVHTVYHAAAYKHVPLVEYNAVEGVRNNAFGTYYCAKAAIESSVESFVLISTDKAVRPTNVMGATKRMAELGLQALAEAEAKKAAKQEKFTRFCMVRFGNVLGSSGSVIPVFKKQIFENQPITVTHPDIIRYFMTIPESAQLVIQAGAMGKGGDVFVLDMGEPVKIVDLAINLIKLSGLEVKSTENPNGDIEIQFTGLRPGEKLFEELLIGDNVQETQHKRIMTANERFLSLSDFAQTMEQLDQACHDFDHEKVREILIAAPTDFQPTDGIGDFVWNATQALKNKIDNTNVVRLNSKFFDGV
ncbi:polysaccharide biosynthesis protein [Marinomonas rhizomae]|uniref:polysaccharide biosynthesis protein n=1 Tax=Marinomonas rhizomae TaxID=491948 RepID=UPI002102D596|nr:nucleoside-diphosphate sugar epimerase/dehydratase [Marinomonas rhizomae]UTW00176.1 polysaccharide biosynthesis protein [Marinomonas rhizomae]